jgi:drug/metabolite transporter (DMT)-like permease
MANALNVRVPAGIEMSSSPITATVADRSAALAGIGFMLMAVFLFALNSAAGKWLVARYPVGEFMLIRSSFTLLFLTPFIWHVGRSAFANVPRPGLQFLRVVLSSLEVAMFFWAVSYLPLADTTTFYLAGPIYVTALSVLLLGERVGWRRWSAVLVGFAGVLIALRPSPSSVTLPALIALSGSVTYALVMITTRMLRQTNDVMLMTTYFLGAIAFGLATSPFGWVTPGAYDVLCLAGVGLANIIAQFCVIRSLKLASASVVVPYQYTLIVWSVVFGWLMFAELPDVYTIAGAAIIIAAGLYIFWRERVTSRGAAADAS